LMPAQADIDREIDKLEKALAEAAAPVIVVANEVGSGIVPEHPLGRRFRDQHGLLNQRMAARADRVVLIVASLPLVLKGAQETP
ncbi:MAG: bifunctional adenosylcobinamide kinase/adenosylcobinamide-phosphate guanylyltransferase, partial [Pseudomonadota bacterium]